MMAKTLLTGLLIMIAGISQGQQNNLKKTPKSEIDILIGKTKEDSTNLFTSSVLNYFLHQQINAISGMNIKEGKTNNTSAIVDDKGITANFSIILRKDIFIQPTISGTAEKGFLGIFSDNEYQKTLSGGLNFQWFPSINNIGFSSATRIKLHNEMRFNEISYNKKYDREITSLIKVIDLYKSTYRNAAPFIKRIDINDEIFSDEIDSNDLILLKILDSCKNILTKNNIISSKQEKYCEIDNALYSKKISDTTEIRKAVEAQYIAYQDSLQLNVKSSYSIKWFSGGIKYNINPQQVLSDTITPSLKPKKFLNEYVTLKIAFNYFKIRNTPNKDKIYISPSINFSSERNFKLEDQRTVDFGSNTTIGGVSVPNINDESYYISIPKRATVLYLDIPFTYFFTKRNYGIDIGMKLGINNPRNNISARIGIYVPLKSGENTIFIEPLMQFDKLFSSGKNDFIKDNVGFGFNISVSLPKYIKS